MSMFFNLGKSHCLTLSLQKDQQVNPPINFHGLPPEVVDSLELLGLTISRDLCSPNYIAKLACKDSHRLGIVWRCKSFLKKSDIFSPQRPLFIAQCSTALHYGLALQPHISPGLCEIESSTLLESPAMRQKHRL